MSRLLGACIGVAVVLAIGGLAMGAVGAMFLAYDWLKAHGVPTIACPLVAYAIIGAVAGWLIAGAWRRD